MSKNTFTLFKNIIDDKYIDCNEKKEFSSTEFYPTPVQIGHLTHFSSCTITYHKHDFLELAFVIEGKFTAVINGKEYLVQKGEIAIYNANTNHMEQPYKNNDAEIYFLSIDNVFFQNHGKNYIIAPTDCPIVNARNMLSQFNMHLMELLIEANSDNLLRNEYLTNLTKLILINILRLLNKEKNDILADKTIQEIKEYIDKHCCENLDLDFLASYSCYSKFYFSRLFKDELGVSPIRYLQNKRMEKAVLLLETTDLSVADISQQVGFQSLAYFCQLFKKIYKTTPSSYRTKNI